MEKNTYFIDIGSQEISQVQVGDNNDFTINATHEEVHQLRELFKNMYNADIQSFFRAHVPAMPYHNDKSNDRYDEGIKKAFEMIHKLGDEKTRDHIESMGVLGAE
ncbi:hydrolase [Radiobacillus sp. PE A8.2]|uniref:hydrolase n=1 Tax=Radiobacillus sp. PE A8.2 TaxID=3380349 RepID=UPI00388F3B68